MMTGSTRTSARVAPINHGAATLQLLSDLVDQIESLPGNCGACEHFASVHETVVQKVDDIHRMLVASRIVTQQPDLQRVLQLTVTRARGLLHADMGGVLILDGKAPAAELFQVEGFEEIPSSVPETMNLLRIPYAQGVAIRADHISEDSGSAGFLPTRPPVGPLLAVPLLREDGAVGTLFVANTPGGRRFSEADELLLLAFAGQIVVFIENERLHAESRQLTLLQERRQLAQRLHNTVVQGLFTIGLQANWCLEHGSLDDGAKRRLRDIQRLSAISGCQLRGAIYALSDPHFSGGGSLVDILEDQIADFQRRSGIAVRLIVPNQVLALGPELSQAIYRIVCESLANVQKHAQAGAAFVTLVRDTESVVVTIEDDGVGLPDVARIQSGSGTMHFGVEMMRQLTAQLGGEFLIADADDGGVMVRARFDLAEEAAS
jgi:signal transduction histidine kinase